MGQWKCNDINAFFIINSNENEGILQYILQGIYNSKKGVFVVLVLIREYEESIKF